MVQEAHAPERVIDRLPGYLRVLNDLQSRHVTLVTSQDIAVQARCASAVVRKDLSYVGHFGQRGQGYKVPLLCEGLREYLGLNRRWSAILIGVLLGAVLWDTNVLSDAGLVLLASFDPAPALVGEDWKGGSVRPLDELSGFLAHNQVDIGLIALGSPSLAQAVADELCASGVRAS